MLLIPILLIILLVQPWDDGGPDEEPAANPGGAAQISVPPAPAPKPKADAPAAPPVASCALATAGSQVGLTLPGCNALLSDTANRPDPEPVWGEVDCAEEARQSWMPSGGDASPQATGQPQPDEGFRRLSVIDGDDVDGERCELGENDRDGPTALFHEGERRVTFLSVRLPAGFLLKADVFQVVMQMKQTQPADNGGGTPVLALEAWDGRWRLRQSDSPGDASDAHELWSAPAKTDTWTRFAFDVTYSQDPKLGSVKVHADLNGDGDFGDTEEQSEAFPTYTLKIETDDGDDGLDEGESIPSHLRVGLYHDPAYSCLAPTGCFVDLDNVQVLTP